MALLGYKDSASFYQTVRTEGIPAIRVNSRRFLFPRAELNAWLESRYSNGRLN